MLLQRGLLALAASCVLCLPACGGPDIDAAASEEVNMSGAGGSGAVSQPTAGSGSATSGSGGAAGAGGAGSAGTSAGSGGAPSLVACSSFMDESNGWSLMVQITNQRKEVLYLGQDTTTCEAHSVFQVEDGARKVLTSLEGCHNSCQALMQSAPVSCPTTCATPSTITLNPGQTIKIPWDGRYGLLQSLPQQCLGGASPGTTSCMQAQRIQANVFTFSARAGTSHSCLAAAGCSCAADQYGTCTTPSSLITGTIITTEYLVKLEPGQTSTGGDPPFIGLVFKE
jgi:hypothetical protein